MWFNSDHVDFTLTNKPKILSFIILIIQVGDFLASCRHAGEGGQREVPGEQLGEHDVQLGPGRWLQASGRHQRQSRLDNHVCTFDASMSNYAHMQREPFDPLPVLNIWT